MHADCRGNVVGRIVPERGIGCPLPVARRSAARTVTARRRPRRSIGRYRPEPMTTRAHLDILEPPGDIAGCEECLKIGDRCVHLRMCQMFVLRAG
jgi:hypothetical protein